MNPTMSRDFFLDDGKIALNTSYEHSDYDLLVTGKDFFHFWIQAVTKGLKKFVLGVRINISDIDTSSIGGPNHVFYFNTALPSCGNFKKITSVETLIVRTIDPLYIIMLEEIIIPSMILD